MTDLTSVRPLFSVILVGLLLVGFIGLPGAPASAQTEESGDTEVAIQVGDITLTKEKFQSNVEGTYKKWLSEYRAGDQTDTPDLDKVRREIKKKLKERYINKMIRRYSLKHTDVEAPDTAVQAYWDRAVKRVGSEEALRKRLRAEGVTKDTFLAQARKRIKKQRFYREKIGDITVSDTKIKSFYEDNKEKFDGKPLTEVRDQIRQTLLKQKRKEALRRLFEKLKQAVEIKVNISGLDSP